MSLQQEYDALERYAKHRERERDAFRRELAELRSLLAGVPGETLAAQIRTLLLDRVRLDFLAEQQRALLPPVPSDPDAMTWLVQDAECETIGEDVTLRGAVDVARMASVVSGNAPDAGLSPAHTQDRAPETMDPVALPALLHSEVDTAVLSDGFMDASTFRDRAEGIRRKFTGHDDDYIIVKLCRRVADLHRHINDLRGPGPRNVRQKRTYPEVPRSVHDAVCDGLRDCIAVHGPVSSRLVGSAAKRIVARLAVVERNRAAVDAAMTGAGETT